MSSSTTKSFILLNTHHYTHEIDVYVYTHAVFPFMDP